jgi:hypothetical protein
MSDSPYMGWIVPHPWQEPEENQDDPDNLLDENFITYEMIPEDNSDYDDEGEFTLR